MARTQAISILNGESAPASLAEIYGLVIENIQKKSLSMALKSRNFSGDPKAGSVEFKRFANSASKAYGTARGAHRGDKLSAEAITVNLDQHKEIVEEVAENDLNTFGVANIMQRRADNHVDSMTRELDRAYFAALATEGTKFTPKDAEADVSVIIGEMITKLEKAQGKYVDGVDRELIDIVLESETFEQFRSYLDTVPNPNVNTAAEEFGMWHGVKIYSSTRLPAGKKALCMVHGAGAQPCSVRQYANPEKIPLSDDYAVSLFYDYGTKTLTPELVLVW